MKKALLTLALMGALVSSALAGPPESGGDEGPPPDTGGGTNSAPAPAPTFWVVWINGVPFIVYAP